MALNRIGSHGTPARPRAIGAHVAAVIAVAIMLATSGVATAHAQLGIAVGAPAPAARVQTLDGRAADLSQVIGKAPLVVEFWATWCPSCKELEPELQRLHAKYGAKVAFVGIAVSANQKPAVVQRYLERHPMPWTHFYDAEGEATGAYDVPATSYIVILDRAGRVVYTGLGGDQKLEPVIAALR